MNPNHFLRRFYRNHLKKIKGAETLKNLLVKVIRKLQYITARRYKLISLSDYSEKTLVSQLIQSNRETVSRCIFHKPPEFNPTISENTYHSPEITAYEIKNVTILGNSDFIFDNEYLIHPDNYDASKHICTIEQHSVGQIFPKQKEAIIPVSATKTIEKAICILGDGAGNYAHFMTEIIPKLIALDEKSLYPDYPVIADGWIGSQLMSILLFFNRYNRKIISLNQWQAISVKNLIYLPPASHVPQDFRENFRKEDMIGPLPDSYAFSSETLNLVRQYALDKYRQLAPKEREKTPYIYLVRKPVFQEGIQYNKRSIANDDEIIQVLKQYHFKMVDVTSLSFIEQIELFSGVEVVVAPVGASMTNMIFAPKNARLISLAPYYENADYSYWLKMMNALKIDLQFVLGHQINQLNGHPMHRDYFISPWLLKKALEHTLNNKTC